MAIAKAITHLRSQASHQFEIYQTSLSTPISTVNKFVMYLLKQYIKQHQLSKLKQAILSEMPSEAELNQRFINSFQRNKLIGIFNEIVTLAKNEQYIADDHQFKQLLIIDDDMFLHMFQFLTQKGYIDKIENRLTNQPDEIRSPESLANLWTALHLLETKQDKRQNIQARIQAQNIKIKQRQNFTDPTATVAGRSVATVNFGRYNDRNNQNKRPVKIHVNQNMVILTVENFIIIMVTRSKLSQ